MTKGSPHVTEELSIHVSNKILTHIYTSQWTDYLKMQRTKQLTSIDLLQRDVLLQQSTEFDLRAVLPAGSVVCEDEVGMAVVEHSQLAQWVCHRLIGSCYLEKVIRRDITLKGLLFLRRPHASVNVLTSFPIRSSLFSRIPHGAIPIAQTFPRDLEEWSFKASPTWRMTPKLKLAK